MVKYHAKVRGIQLEYDKKLDDYVEVENKEYILSSHSKAAVSKLMDELAHDNGYDEVTFVQGWITFGDVV